MQFFLERGSQILTLVNSILDSLGAIAAGNLGAAAKKAVGVIWMARDSSSTDPVILPPHWGRRRMAAPLDGCEWCYECDGDGTCLICRGTCYVNDRLCTYCNGSARCIVCRGHGQLPLGAKAEVFP